MFDNTTASVIAELESGVKTCSHLAGVALVSEDEVIFRLQYLVECGFIIRGSDDLGNTTFEADQKKLSQIVEDSENFGGAAIEGIEKMDSYLN